MDYRVFKADVRFVAVVAGITILSGMAVSWLFYDSWYGMTVILVFAPIVWRLCGNHVINKRKRQLKTEFRETIILISGNLGAGYSLENAIVQTCNTLSEHERMYPIMRAELYRMVNGIGCGQSVDDIFREFGTRSGVQEIADFAGLLHIAKHHGGNMQQLIRQTATDFADSAMVETEIETLVSAKQTEGRIMLAVPFVILAYMRLVNPEYIRLLYTTSGAVVMTVCLFVIAACAFWIEKTVRIEV